MAQVLRLQWNLEAPLKDKQACCRLKPVQLRCQITIPFKHDMLIPFTDGSEVVFNLRLRELLEFAAICIAHHSDLQKQKSILAKPISPWSFVQVLM